MTDDVDVVVIGGFLPDTPPPAPPRVRAPGPFWWKPSSSAGPACTIPASPPPRSSIPS